MRNQKKEGAAQIAASVISRQLGITENSVPIGLILGTGWGDIMDYRNMKEIPFSHIPGFRHLQKLDGHKRSLFLGQISGRSVLILSGRVHLNEAPNDPEIVKMVRLQTEMLLQLGVKTLISTAAVGSLKPRRSILQRLMSRNKQLEVGDIAVIDGFVAAYTSVRPLWGGEFCSPDDVLNDRLNEIALNTGSKLRVKKVGHVMMLGPNFEGRKYEKALLAASGAEAVGMSLFPDACIAALYNGVKFIGLGFVTNDDKEVHSHEENKRRAEKSAVLLNEYLEKIIAKI